MLAKDAVRPLPASPRHAALSGNVRCRATCASSQRVAVLAYRTDHPAPIIRPAACSAGSSQRRTSPAAIPTLKARLAPSR